MDILFNRLVICVSVNPVRLQFAVNGRRLTQNVLAQFIIDENNDAERHTRAPVPERKRTGTKSVKRRDVAEGGTEEEGEDKTEVHHTVRHTLMVDGERPGFANHEVSPLNNDNGDEKGALSVRKSFFRVVARVDGHPIRVEVACFDRDGFGSVCDIRATVQLVLVRIRAVG